MLSVDTNKQIKIIVALDDAHAIGLDNQMLWHLPDDFKFFKATTMGHPMIMGRKTFESIGRPLPGRTSIVITRNKNWKAEGVEVVHSLYEATQLAHSIHDTAFVVGGAEIYKQALPMVNGLYLTKVHTHINKADAFFPAIDFNNWELSSSTAHSADEKHAFSFDIEYWVRK